MVHQLLERLIYIYIYTYVGIGFVKIKKKYPREGYLYDEDTLALAYRKVLRKVETGS